MPIECAKCEKAKGKKWCCVYRLGCLQCCARLVASARPSRTQQEAMFAAIERFRGAPTRTEVLSELNKNEKRLDQPKGLNHSEDSRDMVQKL